MIHRREMLLKKDYKQKLKEVEQYERSTELQVPDLFRFASTPKRRIRRPDEMMFVPMDVPN